MSCSALRSEDLQNILIQDLRKLELCLAQVKLETNLVEYDFKYDKNIFNNAAKENLENPLKREEVNADMKISDSETDLIDNEVDFRSACEEHEKRRYAISSRTHQNSSYKVSRTLPTYLPSDTMKQSLENNFSHDTLVKENEIFRAYLETSKLNSENIHEIFKILLQIEDLTNMSEYVTLAQKNVTLTKKGSEYWIQLDNNSNIEEILTSKIDEVILVPKASSLVTQLTLKHDVDILFPHPHENIKDNTFYRYVGNVEQVSKSRTSFVFQPEQRRRPKNILETKFDIIFRSPRLPLRYQYRALEMLADEQRIRHYFFPIRNPNRQLATVDLELINSKIGTNPEQLQAVRNIVEGPNAYAPYVVFGPPGTGKTTTIVEAIIQLRLRKPQSRILVTAGSNSACDTIAQLLCNNFEENSHRFQNTPEATTLLRIFSMSAIRKGLSHLESLLLKNSNYTTGKMPPIHHLYQSGIIVATLCTVGKIVTELRGEVNFFTHVFIDEAGASTEPETLIGIMGIKSSNINSCQVILSGDHKQLGPVIKSKQAAEMGLQTSMMERLLLRKCYAMDDNGNYDHTLQTRLRRNYRSHPEIVRLYNHLYYNNELISEAKLENVNLYADWKILTNPKFPIIFQAVHGTFGKDEFSPSSYNNLEIQVLMWYLQRLIVDGINGKPVCQTDIGIITPYRLQCRHIQQRLNSRNWLGVEVGSVETFQGREKPIIIVSLVRSFSGLGFVRNPRRLNVILSRPKSMLLLIGNPLTLRSNKDFKFIIEECQRNGTYLRKKKEFTSTLRLEDLLKRSQSNETVTSSVGSSNDSSVASSQPQALPNNFTATHTALVPKEFYPRKANAVLDNISPTQEIDDIIKIMFKKLRDDLLTLSSMDYFTKPMKDAASKLRYSKTELLNFNPCKNKNSVTTLLSIYSVNDNLNDKESICENNNEISQQYVNTTLHSNVTIVKQSNVMRDFLTTLLPDDIVFGRTQLLCKMMRPCDCCPQIHTTVISNIQRTLLRYTTEKLLKLRLR